MTRTARTPIKFFSVLSFSLVALWLLIAAFPFLWTFWGSFKVQSDFFSKADWMYALWGTNTARETGNAFTGSGYYGAWIIEGFRKNFLNSGIVVFFTVIISLTFGTLGGYALARSGFRYAFWILMAALVFRAMPHITLVSGYLLPFFEWNIWGYLPTTIIVLVAMNQPFTIWMLHSFFLNVPKDMDESALSSISLGTFRKNECNIQMVNGWFIATSTIMVVGKYPQIFHSKNGSRYPDTNVMCGIARKTRAAINIQKA